VGDFSSDIEDATNKALSRSDVIVYTGGLGPTEDDLTKEAVCKSLGKKLYLDEKLLSEIKEFFKARDIPMTDNNIKQAYVPEGALILVNELGTADGFFIEHDEKVIVLLPGPPKEMINMFEKYVVPLLFNMTADVILSETINTIGIGESQLETNL